MNLIDYLDRQDRPWHLKLAAILVVLISCADYLAGLEIFIFTLYLLPVSLVSWFVGRREGAFFSFVSSASWYAVEWSLGRQYSHLTYYFWNLAALFGFFMIINFTLAAFKSALKREKNLARVDSLTGLTSARHFQELVEMEIDRSQRYRHPVTLLYLDCDNFKYLNDQFGHQIGNRFLQYLATVLKSNSRSIDTVARLGGDEFAILMPETGEQIVPHAIERLHTRLVQGLRQMGWPVTVSLGAAIHLDPPESAEELIKSADRLMLQAKSEGKNKVIYKIFESPQHKENPLLHFERFLLGSSVHSN